MIKIKYVIKPRLSNRELNTLFQAAWTNRKEKNYMAELSKSLVYIAAKQGKKLVGFINVAWDGGKHGFILDTTVHPGYQRMGIGMELVKIAARQAKKKGLEWLHADYEKQYEKFYKTAGFKSSAAGVMRLKDAAGKI